MRASLTWAVSHLRPLATAIKGTRPSVDISYMSWIQRDQTGATSAEYALVISLIAAVIFGTVAVAGEEIRGLFDAIAGVWP